MKTLFKLFGIVAIASMCAGFMYAHYNRPVEVKTIKVVLRAGDTVEGKASDYYCYDKENRSYAEFRNDVFDANAHLFANGRIPQVGDEVKVEVHQYK